MTTFQKIQTKRIATNKAAAQAFAKKAAKAKHTFFKKQYQAAAKRHTEIAKRITERRTASMAA
jgi:hypothetical protein